MPGGTRALEKLATILGILGGIVIGMHGPKIARFFNSRSWLIKRV